MRVNEKSKIEGEMLKFSITTEDKRNINTNIFNKNGFDNFSYSSLILIFVTQLFCHKNLSISNHNYKFYKIMFGFPLNFLYKFSGQANVVTVYFAQILVGREEYSYAYFLYTSTYLIMC